MCNALGMMPVVLWPIFQGVCAADLKDLSSEPSIYVSVLYFCHDIVQHLVEGVSWNLL